ncbi:BgTH12-02741 [Blumeria graminis f. sp. triticale]|uniref:BgtA-20237 n=3 Tax=Blumeria graminis TaxID=34373 RepID=A0A9X9MI75_BLUGR|nr:hypothetical protein BGT96224_A20237 [Blumeria graminis f. sp. tritici 96224]CAD6503071.1 BgTH12-02741 [Blumeria graminis f. sp. triticale]VDB89009.1 BgtA-20237 [Blumeria graminis f. sp. tritici]
MSDAPVKRSHPTPKLKDSCDMCSASKVRCNKQKPVCDRCERLGCSCFYSPARRVGRPYPRRSTTSLQPSVQSSRHDWECLKNTTSLTLEQELSNYPESTVNKSNAPTAAFESKDDINGISYHGASENSRRVSAICTESLLGEYAGLDPPDFAATLNSSSPCTQDFSHSVHSKLSPPSFQHQTSPDLFLDKILQSDICSSSLDCASVAMQTLIQLDLNEKAQISMNLACSFESWDLDATTKTVMKALRKVTTILICPCSDTSEVGLLVASVCLAVLDVLSILINKLAICRSQNFLTSLGLVPTEHSQGRAEPHIDYSESETINKWFAVRKFLAELPRVSKVMLHFANRYSASSGDFCVSEVLPALAIHVRDRVHAIACSVSDW